jgi:hypothetical protein
MVCLRWPDDPDAPKLRTVNVRSVDNLCEQDGLRLSRLMGSGRHQDPHADAVTRRASAVALSRLDLRLGSAATDATSSPYQVGEGEAPV